MKYHIDNYYESHSCGHTFVHIKDERGKVVASILVYEPGVDSDLFLKNIGVEMVCRPETMTLAKPISSNDLGGSDDSLFVENLD
jgi:hypothetical protein